MKKRILSTLLALAMLITLIPVAAFAEPSQYNDGGGDGSANNPWLISNVTQLTNLATVVNNGTNMSGKYFKLTADIGTLTKSIGKESKPFKGNFDGDGHTVTLNINESSNCVGLFGCVEGGTIKNVITDGTVKCGTDGFLYVSGVIGLMNNSTVINCGNTAEVNTSSTTYVSGLVGWCESGEICNCYNTGNVSGWGYLGGVCGYNKGTIKNCYDAGSMTGVGSKPVYIGNVYGRNANTGTITSCYYSSGRAVGTNEGTSNCSSYSGADDLLNKLNSSITAGGASWVIKSGVNNDLPVLSFGNTVTLNLAGGSYSEAPTGWTYDGDNKGTYSQFITTAYVPALSANPTKAGYQFKEWKSGDTTWVFGDSGTKLTKDTTLIAQWTPNEYTINYDANASGDSTVSGLPEGSKHVIKYDDTSAVNLPTLTRTGYQFVGWATTETGEKTYDANAVAHAVDAQYILKDETSELYDLQNNTGGSTTLYGVWTPNTHDIIFDPNVTSGITVSNIPGALINSKYVQTIKYDTAATLDNKIPTREDNHGFLGWTIEAGKDGIAHPYNAGDNIHTANTSTVINSTVYNNLGSETGKNTTLYAVWSRAWISADKYYDTFKNAANAASSGDIIILDKPYADEADVKVPLGVTIQTSDITVATAQESNFDYAADGKLTFNWGALSIASETTLSISDGTNNHTVTINPNGAAVTLNKDKDGGAVSITGADLNDVITIDGVAYTPKDGETISVLTPHKPFPGASSVTIPNSVAATVIINPENKGTVPALDVTDSRSGEVTLIRNTGDSVYPAIVTVEKSSDTVTITGSAAVGYTTATDSTSLEVDDSGEVTLSDGGVVLEQNETIKLRNSSDKYAPITNPAESGKSVTIKTDTQYPYVLTIPENGKIKINDLIYENASSADELKLGLKVSADDSVTLTHISGEMMLPATGSVAVNGAVIGNETDSAIKVGSSNGSALLTINDKIYSYTKGNAGTGMTVKNNNGVLQFILDETGEALSYTAAAVEISNGSSVYVSTSAESKGSVIVTKTAEGFDAEVVNTNDGDTTIIKVGKYTYTIPEKTTSKFSTTNVSETAILVSGKANLDKDEQLISDSITVGTAMNAVLTVDSGTANDGKIDLTVGSDTLHYDANGATSPDLCFLSQTGSELNVALDDKKEILTVDGTVSVDVNIVNNDNGGNTIVSAKAASTGDIVIANNSYDVTVSNDEGETSEVTVGKYTYKVPEGKSAKLSAASDSDIATLVSGMVELDKGTSNNGEVVTISTDTTYKIKNSSTNSVTEPITVSKTENGASIAVPSGDAFTVITAQYPDGVRYETKAGTGITTTYVTDGSGNVKLADGTATKPEEKTDIGVKLNLDKGSVDLAIGQTIYANVPSENAKLIYNPASNSGKINVNAGDGTVNTEITIAKDQIVELGGVLRNGSITGSVAYVATTEEAKLAITKNHSPYPDGTVILLSGEINIGAGGSIGAKDANTNYIISVPTGKPIVSIAKNGDYTDITINPNGECIITVNGSPVKTYKYVNSSSEDVVVKINNDGLIKTVPNADAATENLPSGSYDAYVINIDGNTTTYTFKNNLDTILAKANLGDNDTAVVINTALTTKPSTTSYILTKNGYDIYGVSGNLKKDDTHKTIDGVYTVDCRERAKAYSIDPSNAAALSQCMVVKITEGEIAIQAGEAKIDWGNGETAYYVTLADAFYDAAHSSSEGTAVNAYNTHDGKNSSQTIEMNINPYANRIDMPVEAGDILITRGEDSGKEGDKYEAKADAVISMLENKNDVYLSSGSLKAEAASSDTDNIVTVFVSDDAKYFAQSEKPIIVTGGKTSDAVKFDDIVAAASVTTTVSSQFVKVGTGAEYYVELTAGANSTYPIARVGKLTNAGDSVVVKGTNTNDYIVYSLADHLNKYTDNVDKYIKITDLAKSASDSFDMTITNNAVKTSIVSGGALCKAVLPKDATLAVTINDKVYNYVNLSIDKVELDLTNAGLMTTVLNEASSPSNLPDGRYDAYTIKEETNAVTFTFLNGMDKILSKAALENGKVNTVVINTNLATKPSTSAYIYTKDKYDVYGVDGHIKNGQTYAGILDAKTVDARERAKAYTLPETYVNAIAKALMIKVENGKVFIEASEAKIRWSQDDTTYYLTLSDAISAAAERGKDSSQYIEMNMNPYMNREEMHLENGDILITCGEDMYDRGDLYTGKDNAVISMFKANNDVYLNAGKLKANPADETDDTATIYVNMTDSGYFAQSKMPIIVAAGETFKVSKLEDINSAAKVFTTANNQAVTIGTGLEERAEFTALNKDTSYPIARVGILYSKGDSVVVKGSNVFDYTVYSLMKQYKTGKDEVKEDYAVFFSPKANLGDVKLINGFEKEKDERSSFYEKVLPSTVSVITEKEKDTYSLWIPEEKFPVIYTASENNAAAKFITTHDLALSSGGLQFVGKEVFNINGVSYYGKDFKTVYSVAHRLGEPIVNICDEVTTVNVGQTLYVGFNAAERTVKYKDKTYTSVNSSAGIVIPGREKELDPSSGSYIYEDDKDLSKKHFFVYGPVSSGYTVQIEKAENGSIKSDRLSAGSGATVTLTVSPDSGFTLDTLKVVDKNGNEVELTSLGNNKYSLKMPASKITVSATFKEGSSVLNFFVDVKESDYFYNPVMWAAEGGITSGVDATHFDPEGVTTRGQMITFLWRMAGSPVIEDDQVVFTDIKKKDYFYSAVVWGWNMGIVSGKGANTFAPDDLVTRAEAVTFIYRYAKVAGGDLPNPFIDIKKDKFYYYPVLWAANNNITSGVSATKFGPDESCLRGQIVTFLYRFNENFN